ncbi:MAG: adenylosuccinate lyase [Nitrospirota bacterium]
MIDRYSRPAMRALWSTSHKYETWLRVELAACDAMAEEGLIPSGAAAVIRSRARINEARIEELERVTQHDVLAFVNAVAETVGPEGRFLHEGLTSSDVLDTALAVILREATAVLRDDLARLHLVLRELAFRHRDTVMIGRSHGVHGEPITFGLKIAVWYEEVGRHRRRLERADEEIGVGKLSGSMGTFAHLPPSIEARVCTALGLVPDPVSSQIIQRDRHAAYMACLGLIAASLEKFAVEIRHLQRTEVLEVEEYFAAGQKGSSSMPHKRNPIGSENISGLARVVKANVQAAFDNVALWHERDISHSSVERVIVPDTTTVLDYMLDRLTTLLERLQVYPDRMRKNLEQTGGLVYSQRVMLALVERGLSRDEAYAIVQGLAMRAWKGEGTFVELAKADPTVAARLAPDALDACFDPAYFVRHTEEIFQRVFGAAP